MGVTISLAKEISTVSPLHDIGKVGIVDNIMKKPNRLTDEEFEIMKHHTLIGGELISEIYVKTKSLPMRLAFEITMYHHERWNGKGYPASLSGNGIPVAARIMALADVYDALTTDRVYKKAFVHEKAKSIIVKETGEHFDPRIVEAFLATEDKFKELKETLQDK
jgi:putative two-component system response regulator